jgi:hypothetical protein
MSRDSGARRVGLTEAIHTWGWWLQYIVWGHLWLNYSAVLGHYPAEGTADLVWTISGTTAEGPFTISNRWMTYSEWDATDVIWRLLWTLDVLRSTDLEDVTVTGISTHGSITRDELVGEMTRLRVASTSQPDLRSRATLLARPGDVVTVQAVLELAEGGTQTITASFHVPRGTSGSHRIVVRGGKERGLDEDFPSFDALLRALNGGEHPDDLVIAGLGRTRLRPQDLIIEGRDAFRLRIVR